MFNVGTDAITDKPYIQDKKDHLNEFVANVLRDNIGLKKSASSLSKK